MRSFTDYNVLFVTIDCCRFDTLMAARAPTLRWLGEIRKAHSYGSYTLPSHMSMFTGYLPNVMEPPGLPYYSREIRQLWRLAGARARDPRTVGAMLEGHDLFEGYRRLGFHTIGAGGVRWFSNALLTRCFDEFHFFGGDDHEDVFEPRCPQNFALEQSDALLASIPQKQPWFLFINAHETHVPYDTGEDTQPPEVRELLEYARPLWGGKSLNVPDREISTEILRPLFERQVAALEVVDARLGRLLERLPTPLLVVVCGDHGEAFGESFDGKPRFGHGFPSAVVMEVPMVVAFLE